MHILRQCVRCGIDLPVSEDLRYCPNCGSAILSLDLGLPLSTAKDPVPFDVIERHGFWRALIITWWDAMLRPSEFFARVPVTRDAGWAILFAILVGTSTSTVAMLERWALGPMLSGWIRSLGRTVPSSGSGLITDWEQGYSSPLWQIALVGAQPIWTLVQLLIVATVFHAMLAILGGARNGFTQTIRTVAYAHAPFVWLVLPTCGNFVSIVWLVALCIIGLARAHETDDWRAACAVLIPAVFGCLACCGLFLFAGIIVRGGSLP